MKKPIKIEFYFSLAAYIVILGAVLIIANFVKNTHDKVLFFILIGIFTVLLTFFTPEEGDSKLKKIIYFALQSLVIAIPTMIRLEFTPFLFLFFILSAQGMIAFEMKEGLILVTLFSLITVFSFIAFNIIAEAISISVSYVGGYYFFGIFGYTMKTAEKNRAKLEEALKELSETHEKLKNYTIKAEELAVSKERVRISQDLHDTIGHYLTVASVQLEGAAKLSDKDRKKSRKMLENANLAVKEALRNLRDAVSALRNPIEAELPLNYSLEQLAKSFTEATEIKVNIKVEEYSDNDKRIREMIYRIVQELLTNVKKHSDALNIWLSLKVENNLLNFSFLDDGKGFDLEKGTMGFGLSGIKRRVEELGGEMYISNNNEKGASVQIKIPLNGEI